MRLPQRQPLERSSPPPPAHGRHRRQTEARRFDLHRPTAHRPSLPLAAEARYLEHLTRLTPQARVQIVARLVTDGRALARLGLRQRHPEASPEEIEVRLIALLYGPDVGSRLQARVSLP